MFIFNFLIILLLILIVIVIFSTVIKLSLFFTNRYNYDSSILVLPSLLSFINCIVVLYVWYLTISKLFQIDLFTFIINLFIKSQQIQDNSLSIYLISSGFVIFFILVQSFIFLTVNIDYNKAKGKTRVFVKKVLKIKLDQGNSIAIYNPSRRLSFINSLIASIFSFALVFFVSIMLYSIGHLISDKLI